MEPSMMYERADLHRAIEQTVGDIANGRPLAAAVAVVCHAVLHDQRTVQDQLPGSLAQLIADLDREPPPATYGDAAKRVLAWLE